MTRENHAVSVSILHYKISDGREPKCDSKSEDGLDYKRFIFLGL